MPGSINVTASPGNVNNGAKTDAVGDDIAEYDSASRTVRVRVGTGATATCRRTLAPNATVTFKFRAALDRPAAGTTIANDATLAYRARTIDKAFTFTGNVVTTPVAALADLAVTKSSSPASVRRRRHGAVPDHRHQQRSDRGQRVSRSSTRCRPA